VIDVRRANQRFHTNFGWLDSWHSFSFGEHHDPANVGHGLLLVSNDDRVEAGAGFGTHGHRDMEIVTWVLEGALRHRDTSGADGVIVPGLAQRMSAGRGIRHSEMNASETEPVHFVQMWVVPDTAGVEPSYAQSDVSAALDTGELIAVASGQGHDGAVMINQRDAVLWAARPAPGGSVVVPDGGHVHVFVARGPVDLDGIGPLQTGDAVRLTGEGPRSAVAGDDGAEILVWVTA
jgi:quercetin 2,3-dioxygenase